MKFIIDFSEQPAHIRTTNDFIRWYKNTTFKGARSWMAAARHYARMYGKSLVVVPSKAPMSAGTLYVYTHDFVSDAFTKCEYAPGTWVEGAPKPLRVLCSGGPYTLAELLELYARELHERDGHRVHNLIDAAERNQRRADEIKDRIVQAFDKIEDTGSASEGCRLWEMQAAESKAGVENGEAKE